MPALNIDKTDSTGVRFVRYENPDLYPVTPTFQTFPGQALSRFIKKRETATTPGWRKLKPKPMNPFYFLEQKFMYSTGFSIQVRASDRKLIATTTGCWSGTAYEVPTVSSRPATALQKANADATCRTKVLLKVKDQKINVAQFVAEREQTMRLFTETATKMAQAIQNLKRGNIAAAADNLGLKISNRGVQRYKKSFKSAQSDAVASGWLSLQYGWLPLIGDAVGSAEFLSAQINDFKRSRAVAKHTLSLDDRWVEMRATSSGVPLRVENHSPCEYTVKYIVNWTQNLAASQTLGQLGLTNPAVLAWELLPYSFVVDWFLPIGDWLNSFDATLGLSFKSGCCTTFERRQTYAVGIRNSERVGPDIITSRIESSTTTTECRRSILTDFPSVAWPVPKNPLSVTHLANALALLRKSFRM